MSKNLPVHHGNFLVVITLFFIVQLPLNVFQVFFFTGITAADNRDVHSSNIYHMEVAKNNDHPKTDISQLSAFSPSRLLFPSTHSSSANKTSATRVLLRSVREAKMLLSSSSINTYHNRRPENSQIYPHHMSFNDISTNEPYFEETDRNVSAPLGGTAYLQCRVNNLGNRYVSWVRQRDLHILTTGNFTYTSNARFRTINPLQSKSDWTLEIKEAQLNDTGVYECQISTETKLFISVYLKVVDVKAKILSESPLYLQKKTNINLSFLINFSPDTTSDISSLVFWYHNNKYINYGSRAKVKTRETINSEDGTKNLLSTLLITNTTPNDSGNYSCELRSNKVSLQPAMISVQVLNGGENPAAIQHGRQKQKSLDTSVGTKCSLSVYVSALYFLHVLLTLSYSCGTVTLPSLMLSNIVSILAMSLFNLPSPLYNTFHFVKR